MDEHSTVKRQIPDDDGGKGNLGRRCVSAGATPGILKRLDRFSVNDQGLSDSQPSFCSAPEVPDPLGIVLPLVCPVSLLPRLASFKDPGKINQAVTFCLGNPFCLSCVGDLAPWVVLVWRG
jgi:hypothetical protein